MSPSSRRAALLFLVSVALVLPETAPGTGDRPKTCDETLLVEVHRRLEPVVSRIAEVHFNSTGGRHYEVVEIISLFQAHQLCQSALNYIESLRLALCFLVCPDRFSRWAAGPSGGNDRELTELLRLSPHLDEFFADVRYLASGGGGGAESPEAAAAWDFAEGELREVTLRLEQWAVLQQSGQGRKLLMENFMVLDPLLQRLLGMVQDFLVSLTEDLSTLFHTPNFVAREMLPSPQQSGAESEARVSPTGVNIFFHSEGGTTFAPAFMEMLRHAPAPLAQPSFVTHPECKAAAAAAPAAASALAAVPREFVDATTLAHRDVSGNFRRVPSPLQLLHSAARHTRLSDLVISLQVPPYLVEPAPSCGSKFVLWDPTRCLLESQWGGYTFHVNPLPPFNLTVVYHGKALGPGAMLSATDVHSVHVPSRDTQWGAMVSTFKSMNHHSPDLLFLNPFVGNCQIVDRLLNTGAVKPKLVYMPINPLKPPPAEEVPSYIDWWRDVGDAFVMQLKGVPLPPGADPTPVTTSMWLAQCSVASAAKMMQRQGYTMLHVEHTYAVFMWQLLHDKIVAAERLRSDGVAYAGGGAVAGGGPATSFVSTYVTSDLAARPSAHGDNGVGAAASSMDGVIGQDDQALRAAWLAGWHCSPHARYLFDLDVFAGSGAAVDDTARPAAQSPFGAPSSGATDSNDLSKAAMRDLAASTFEELPALRYFLERRSEGGRSTRGHCVEGVCECFPPYRGRLCEHTDTPRTPQTVNAAIHYITAETERDLLDLERSLASLWTHFNWRHDYPVIVFHEGLSPAARSRIVFASENRVWLVMLPQFKEVPREWAEMAKELAQEFSVGYRAMIRWRSGPIFLEPALGDFDYAMTLDTDSYFPGDIHADPFEILHREGLVATFPHLGRESASVVVNFMHYYLLYCNLRSLHPRRTRMLASLIETNFKWYQQCLMLDMEVLRLDWFRGGEYQDMFRYMDSTGGFWLHRWGNNPFRTFAVGLLLDDANVSSLTLPYAHQDYCSCGPSAPPCVKDSALQIYRCEAAGGSQADAQCEESDGRGGVVCARHTVESGQAALGDLAEGFLDLQPWRGTDRQKARFQAQDIHNFVEEQITF